VIFYRQINLVRIGKTREGKAISLYATYTIAPVVLYGVVFLALVGPEEFTGTSIIGEGYARSLIFVIAGCTTAVLQRY
jgi:hypothetical protein